MVKFGLQAVKILALTCTTLIMGSAIALTIRAAIFRNAWNRNIDQLGVGNFQIGADFGFFIGLVVIVVTIFGFLAICLNGYGMLIFYDVLLSVVALTMAIYGMILWIEVKSDAGKHLAKLKALVHSFTIENLSKIQLNFKCCGIEKYTDYLKLWDIWNESYIGIVTSPKPTMNLGSAAPIPLDKLNRSRSLKNYKKDSWRNIPFRVGEGGSIEYSTERVPHANEPTRVWKAARPTPTQKPKYFTFPKQKKVVGVWFGTISSWFGDIWSTLYNPLKEIVSKLYGSAMDMYKFLVPDIFQVWITALYQYVYSWYSWTTAPLRSAYRWWYGSGWDELMMTHFSYGDKALLPYSCCRNPSRSCSGRRNETWLGGCRDTLLWYWKSSNLELAVLFLCFFVNIIITIIVVYVLIGGIREKYYF